MDLLRKQLGPEIADNFDDKAVALQIYDTINSFDANMQTGTLEHVRTEYIVMKATLEELLAAIKTQITGLGCLQSHILQSLETGFSPSIWPELVEHLAYEPEKMICASEGCPSDQHLHTIALCKDHLPASMSATEITTDIDTDGITIQPNDRARDLA